MGNEIIFPLQNSGWSYLNLLDDITYFSQIYLYFPEVIAFRALASF